MITSNASMLVFKFGDPKHNWYFEVYLCELACELACLEYSSCKSMCRTTGRIP